MPIPAAAVVLGGLAVLNDALRRPPPPPKSKTVRGQLVLPAGWGSCVDMRARALAGGGGLRSGEVPCASTNPDQLGAMSVAKCKELAGGDPRAAKACELGAGKAAEAVRAGTRTLSRVVSAVQGALFGSGNCKFYFDRPPSGYVVKRKPSGAGIFRRPGTACRK